MNLCNIDEVRALLSRHGFHFSKSMGQNFLIQSWVPQQIAEASGADRDTGVLEIGPGIGPLTRELASRAGKVVSLELDRSLEPILKETLSDCPNAQVIFADVTKTDCKELVEQEFFGMKPMVCANLPYNITTPVITQLLVSRCFRRLTVMIQKEAAQRICAKPGTSNYCAFSLLCQYFAHCEPLFDVPRDCFLPAPKVTSTVLQLNIGETPTVSVANEALLLRVINASFAQRRKTLQNGLSSAFSGQLSKEQIVSCIEEAGLPAAIRGEKMGLEDFARLTDCINAKLQ